MNNFDFNSKKYTILLFLVCMGFLILTIKAFEYLPTRLSNDNENMQQPASNTNISTQIKANSDDENENDNEDENEDMDEEDPDKHKSGHIDFMPKTDNTDDAEMDFDEIQAPKGAINEDLPQDNDKDDSAMSPEEEALKAYLEGKKYYDSKDYSKALYEFQKISDLTKDKELNALGYESIAEIYTIYKKYGTALSFAIKAYHLSPSNSRDMLIARIYYKSGNTENAISRMNNILKKGF